MGDAFETAAEKHAAYVLLLFYPAVMAGRDGGVGPETASLSCFHVDSLTAS